MVGQPEHWATIADAANGIDPASRGPRIATIAEGASIANPVRLAETVEAVQRSNGVAVAISEPQIRAAVRKLAARGLYAEPTSGSQPPRSSTSSAPGVILPGQRTVVVLTGAGLKSAEKMAAIFSDGGPTASSQQVR